MRDIAGRLCFRSDSLWWVQNRTRDRLEIPDERRTSTNNVANAKHVNSLCGRNFSSHVDVFLPCYCSVISVNNYSNPFVDRTGTE